MHGKYKTMHVILEVQRARLGWTARGVWYSKRMEDRGNISHLSSLLSMKTMFWINCKPN
jgi:hypothetical protein